MRATSLEAYRTIKENGLLSKRRLQVYEYIYKHGPCTRRQVEDHYADVTDSIRPRFAELRDRGVIYEVKTAKCSTTGHNVILWDVTGNLPDKVVKKRKSISKKVLYDLLKKHYALYRINKNIEAQKSILNLVREVERILNG